MQRYWEQHPPVGDLVAAYFGYQGPVGAGSPRPGRRDAAPTYGSPEEMMAAFGSMGGNVKR